MATHGADPKSAERTASRASVFESLLSLLPDRAEGWTVKPPDQRCDRQGIYGYMDGAAEVYLTWAFRGLVVRRYVKPNAPDVVVELFDMTRSFDAYGVFTNGRDEELPDAGIGQGAELRPGLLTFWRDRYFGAVRVDAVDVPPDSKKVLRTIGRKIAEAVGRDGPLPKVLSCLPEENRVHHAERYLNGPDALNYHYDLGMGNPLHLSAKVDAVLATYRYEKQRCYLLCALYPARPLREKARRDFVKEVAKGAEGTEATKSEDGRWLAVKAKDLLLAVVFDAPSREIALRLCERAIDRCPASRQPKPKKEP